MPLETMDIKSRAWVALERFGRSERANRSRDVVVPRAGKGIVFFVVKGVIFAQSQAWLGPKQRNTVNLAAWHRDVLLIAPPHPAKKSRAAVLLDDCDWLHQAARARNILSGQ